MGFEPQRSKEMLYAWNCFTSHLNFVVNRRNSTMELQSGMGVYSFWRSDDCVDYHFDFVAVRRYLNMYERRHCPVAPWKVFIRRIVCNLLIGFALIALSLGLGMIGYGHFEKMGLVDAFENAAMILSGMGPVDTMETTGGKIFAGSYALFSGIIFLVVITIIIAPIFHRFFHQFLIKDR